MKFKTSSLCITTVIVLLTGCTTQSLVPASDPVTIGEVCITPDNSNRKVAYQSTIKALQQKGFVVKEVSVGEARNCKTLISCQSVSRWDVSNFTSTINYEWFEDGKLISSARYHNKGGLNFSKYINTQEKVNDMLNKMLPSTPKLPSRYDKQTYSTQQ